MAKWFGLKGKGHKKVDVDELWHVGVAAEQGTRPAMEDAHVVMSPLLPRSSDPTFLLAIFDGHNGAQCSSFLGEHIVARISQQDSVEASPEKAIRETLQNLESQWLQEARVSRQEDGSTGLCALFASGTLTIAHAGDSRAILCQGGKAIPLTVDHSPSNPEEAKRIVAAGGTVIGGRVQGKLGVSRSFGDLAFKEAGIVSCEPDISSIALGADCNYLVLACDGLFEQMSNEDVIDFISSQFADNTPPSEVAANLAEEAIFLGSKDNVTVIILKFEEKLQGMIASNSFKSSKCSPKKSPRPGPSLSKTTEIPPPTNVDRSPRAGLSLSKTSEVLPPSDTDTEAPQRVRTHSDDFSTHPLQVSKLRRSQSSNEITYAFPLRSSLSKSSASIPTAKHQVNPLSSSAIISPREHGGHNSRSASSVAVEASSQSSSSSASHHPPARPSRSAPRDIPLVPSRHGKEKRSGKSPSSTEKSGKSPSASDRISKSPSSSSDKLETPSSRPSDSMSKSSNSFLSISSSSQTPIKRSHKESSSPLKKKK